MLGLSAVMPGPSAAAAGARPVTPERRRQLARRVRSQRDNRDPDERDGGRDAGNLDGGAADTTEVGSSEHEPGDEEPADAENELGRQPPRVATGLAAHLPAELDRPAAELGDEQQAGADQRRARIERRAVEDQMKRVAAAEQDDRRSDRGEVTDQRAEDERDDARNSEQQEQAGTVALREQRGPCREPRGNGRGGSGGG